MVLPSPEFIIVQVFVYCGCSNAGNTETGETHFFPNRHNSTFRITPKSPLLPLKKARLTLWRRRNSISKTFGQPLKAWPVRHCRPLTNARVDTNLWLCATFWHGKDMPYISQCKCNDLFVLNWKGTRYLYTVLKKIQSTSLCCYLKTIQIYFWGSFKLEKL